MQHDINITSISVFMNLNVLDSCLVAVALAFSAALCMPALPRSHSLDIYMD